MTLRRLNSRARAVLVLAGLWIAACSPTLEEVANGNGPIAAPEPTQEGELVGSPDPFGNPALSDKGFNP